MQWLVNVTNEVYHELSRLGPTIGHQFIIKQLLRVILDRDYDAASLLAVALKVHTTVGWWFVFGVYEMEVLGEAAWHIVLATPLPKDFRVFSFLFLFSFFHYNNNGSYEHETAN